MTDVLLTHSYFLRFDPKEERAMTPYPPLGTITAAAQLRAHGFTVALHDVMFSASEEDIRQALVASRPRLVLIYDDNFNYLTKMCLSRMRQAAFTMAGIAASEGVPVAVFSSDATDHIEEYLHHGASFVLCGEADMTSVELSRALLSDTSIDIREIRGIAFRDAAGKIHRTSPRPVIRDLDSLSTAAWDLVDMDRYRSAWMEAHRSFSLNISTTRGCPFHCNWCAKPLYGQVYNSRSPEAVVDEILLLKRTYRPDHIWITDDIFGLTPGWVSRFADLVEQRDARVPFKCLSRADLLLVDRTISDLRRAGCTSVWLGAESGSQAVLDAMEKGTTVEQIRVAAGRLHMHGIRVGFFLQFGYPGETLEDIDKTMALVRECGPDEIGISVSYPLPGTPFFERVRREMSEKQNWTDSQDLDMMFAGAFPPDFYRSLHRLVHTRFGIWRGVRSLTRALQHPLDPPPGLMRHIAVMAYNMLTLGGVWIRTRALARSAA